MERYNGQLIRQFASNVSGNAASGVTVTVRRQSDDAIATLYADNNTAGATLLNPLTTSAVGHFAFYAADGVYTLTFSDNTPQQVIQLQDVSALQAQFDAAVLAGGYIPSGTFAAGATLTQSNQILSDGSAYWRWDGSLPKTAAAGSSPTPTGVGGWIVLSDQALRGDLAAANSTVLVGAVKALDLGRKYGEFVLVDDYSSLVIAGDWTSAWNAALATGKNVAGSKGVNYSISGQLHCVDNQYIDLRKSTITQTAVQTPVFNAVGHIGVTVTGGKLVGKAESTYVNSSSSLAIGVLGTGASNLKVYDMEFDGFYYSPLMVASGGNRIWFFDNTVTGIPAVLSADTNRRNTTGATIIGQKIRVINNTITGTASGLIVGQGSFDVIVDKNIVHDTINEHGMYFDTGIKKLVITNNIIYDTGVFGTGLKVQFYDAFGVDPQSTIIKGNVIVNTGSDGILIANVDASPTRKLTGLIISDNIVIDAGAYGIYARDSVDVSVNNNIIINPLQAGIAYGRCSNIDIVDNKLRGTTASGIRDLVGPSAVVNIVGNKLYNCCTGNISGDEFGILIFAAGTTGLSIKENIITDDSANMQYGVYIQPNINAQLRLVDNETDGASGAGVRFGFTGALKEYTGNKWRSASIPAFNGPALPAVASAGTVIIPSAYDVFSVTGTTTINTIEATANAGKRITMIFSAALTVSLSGNIKMATAFTATADKVLTLVSDGTFWYG